MSAIGIAPGGNYGDRAEQERLAAVNRGPATPAGPTPPPAGVPGVGTPGATPGAPGQPPTGQPPAGVPGATPTPSPTTDPFAATQRPGEPITTQPPAPPTQMVDQTISMMFAATGDPWLLTLMQERG